MSRENAIRRIKEWRANPCKFVEDNFKVVPDIWQEQALMAFADKDQKRLRISLQACAGPGKSTVLSWIGLNFLSCYGEPGEHPKGAAVSITEDNLRDNLWSELSKWLNKSRVLSMMLTWTASRIYANEHPETWFLSAKSFPKSADKEALGKTLSGIHSKYVLFLIDESGAIPVEVGKAAEQALSTCHFGRILQAGNPISLDGLLYAASKSEYWKVIRITGDPDDPHRSNRIDINWAAEQIARYGRNDPWVKAYILGQFPDSSINTLLSITEVEDAMGKHLTEDKYSFSQKRLGIDVARFGLDSTIIFPRQGLAAFKYAEMRGARSDEIAARVMMAKRKWKSEMEFVDGTGGFGSGVIDSLRQAGQTPHEVHFSSRAIDERYYNKRAEMWMEMADWVKRGAALPDCQILKKELLAPTYTFRSGKFILESKEQIKSRLGYSPDRADALALTFAMPDMPAMTPELAMSMGKNYRSDYDPFSEKGAMASEYDPFSSGRL